MYAKSQFRHKLALFCNSTFFSLKFYFKKKKLFCKSNHSNLFYRLKLIKNLRKPNPTKLNYLLKFISVSNNSDDFWTTRAVDLELNTSNYTLLKYKYAFLVVFDKMFMTVENSIFQPVVSYVP